MKKLTLAPWLTPALGYSSVGIILIALFFTFTAAPDVLQGYLTRILPIHVGSSWLAYLSFVLAAAFGLAYLITRNFHWDRLSLASTEIGVVFIILSLFTGALWGRPTWGAYWSWGDARLTTTALMLMVYVGMLMVRGMIEDGGRRARVSAVIGIVASVGVPINYMSVYWWNTLHQPASVLKVGGPAIHSSILTPLLVMAAGLFLAFIAMHLMAMRNEILRRRVKALTLTHVSRAGATASAES